MSKIKISPDIITLIEHLGVYLMKFLKWLWKHLFIIIIATVVTIFMGYLATRWIRYNDTYLYRYLFQDSNGKFAWTGFTAIIAIITLAINAWDNRRKFKADLISKSRLEWLARVEKITADLYSNYYKLIDDSYSYFSSQDLHEFYKEVLIKYKGIYRDDTKNKILNELNGLEMVMNKAYNNKTDHGAKFKQAYAELTMALFDSEKNKKLYESLDIFIEKVNKFNDDLDEKIRKIDVDKLAIKDPKSISNLANEIKVTHLKFITEYRESKEITDVFDNIKEHLHEQWELAKRGE